MKVQTQVLIDADRETVWRAFDNPDNMTRWQPTLKSVTHKSGDPGQPGALSELVYDENGRDVVMTERITERRDPDFLAGSYESNWGTTVIVNHFEKAGDGQTRWISYSRHSFKGVMRFLALFMRKSICKRLDDDMQRFKLLVESQVAG
jgi:uncharacterized protein YndB with AHSA1/START domain